MRQLLKSNSVCFLLLAFASPPAGAASINYSDSFEASAINPFWSVIQSNGTISPSTDLSHSGVQSAKFTSASGGQRELHLYHDFGGPIQGTASIWFYDYAPGQQTLYEFLRVYTAADGVFANGLGVQDFDASCYAAYTNNTGPNANCGAFPGGSTTSIQRTFGWHLFQTTYGPAAITMAVDGQLVHSLNGNYTFDRVELHMFGPSWRPDTIAYWDDFQIAADPVPEPGTFSLLACAAGLGVLGRVRRARAACKRNNWV